MMSGITYPRIAAFAAVLLFVWLFLRLGSPISEKTSLTGTVTGFVSGRSTLYHVRLDDGTVIYIGPPPLGLPTIGSKVAITRRTHADGRVIYKFRDMFD
jgi:hypothetical protein